MLQQMQFRSFPTKMSAMHCPAPALGDPNKYSVRTQGARAPSAHARAGFLPSGLGPAQSHPHIVHVFDSHPFWCAELSGSHSVKGATTKDTSRFS